MTTPHISTYWHAHYINAARLACPAITADHELAVGWKITRVDGTTRGGYYWPLVNGDHDLPVLHEATDWSARNEGSCPDRPGDGLCLVTTHAGPASSGGVRLASSIGHVLVFAPALARTNEPGKFRAPWVVDVDCFDPVGVIRLGLSSADLGGADLRGADLGRANLASADLWSASADLWGANLRGANLRGADLRSANLRSADLGGANLQGASLWRANLRGADLGGADLWGANLRGANLRGADLRSANLRGADLGGANLRGADLGGANLQGALHDRWTRWPDGFTPPAVAA